MIKGNILKVGNILLGCIDWKGKLLKDMKRNLLLKLKENVIGSYKGKFSKINFLEKRILKAYKYRGYGTEEDEIWLQETNGKPTVCYSMKERTKSEIVIVGWGCTWTRKTVPM